MTGKLSEPYLRDIVRAIEHARTRMGEVTLEEFENDLDRLRIVERNVEIISEASRRLPDDFKDRHPEIPWQKVAGVGNILRHDYDEISHRILWNIVRQDLAPLEKVCKIELLRTGFQQDGEHTNDNGGRSR